jgi:hypothetical protein
MSTVLAICIAAAFLASFIIRLMLYFTSIGAQEEIRAADSGYAAKVLRGPGGATFFGGPVRFFDLFRYEPPVKVLSTISLIKGLCIAYSISLAVFFAAIVILAITKNG